LFKVFYDKLFETYKLIGFEKLIEKLIGKLIGKINTNYYESTPKSKIEAIF